MLETTVNTTQMPEREEPRQDQEGKPSKVFGIWLSNENDPFKTQQKGFNLRRKIVLVNRGFRCSALSLDETHSTFS